MIDTPVMKTITKMYHEQSYKKSAKFKTFLDIDVTSQELHDEYKWYVDQTKGLALAYWTPDGVLKYQYNTKVYNEHLLHFITLHNFLKGEQVLHVGEEHILGNYYGLNMRKNYIFLELITL